MDTHQPMDVDMEPNKLPQTSSSKDHEQFSTFVGKRRRVSVDPNCAVDDASRADPMHVDADNSEDENEVSFQPGPKRVRRRVSCELDEMGASTKPLPQQPLSLPPVARLPLEVELSQEQRTTACRLRVSDDVGDVRANRIQPKPDPLSTQHHKDVGVSRKPHMITPSSSFVIFGSDSAANVSGSGSEIDSKCEGRALKDQTQDAQDAAAQTTNDVPIKVLPLVAAEQTTAHKPPKTLRRSWLSIIALILPLLFFIEANLLIAERIFDLPFDPAFSLHGDPIEHDSVYVPGAGFSGFWFTLGRLRSIPDPASKSYYCYSAGCLGVVATLSDRDRDEMYQLASDAQRLWQQGEIGLYDVVPKFVDGLLSLDADTYLANDDIINASNTTSKLPTMTDANLLSKINIITTRKENRMRVKHEIRKPTTIQELREGLIHTTWIPFATGGSIWAQDTKTGHHYMDGAFSSILHPICTYHLGLPFMMDLFLNTLNVNLGKDKVEKYWDAGVSFGSGVM